MAHPSTEERATKKDWAKAITCSILLLLLLLFLFWPKWGNGLGGGFGDGFGDGGFGPGGLGLGFGIGVGSGSGTGETGSDSGGEESGSAGGGKSDLSTMGGDAEAESVTTFGSNSRVSDGKNENEVDSNSDSESRNPFAGEGDAGSADLPDNLPVATSDEIIRQSGNNTLAIIQPNAAPAAPTTTGNRFVGGAGNSGASGGTDPGKNIGGMTVRGGSLGVILDVSGSMHDYLEDLRAEITANFSDAAFLEVSGCSIRTSDFNKEEFLNNEPPSTNHRLGVMDAMRELVEVYQVDAVYWFCDLEDRRNLAGLQQLRNLVWGKEMSALKDLSDPNGGNPGFNGLKELNEIQKDVGSTPGSSAVFRLYVRSTGEVPDANLKRIINESGGQFQKKK